jgi:hypothetical protein
MIPCFRQIVKGTFPQKLSTFRMPFYQQSAGWKIGDLLQKKESRGAVPLFIKNLREFL